MISRRLLGERDTAATVAKYNGIAMTLRPATRFRVLTLGADSEAPTFGAHAHSWARLENDEVVLLALRPVLPGQETPSGREPNDAAFRDLVQAAAPVIVASRGARSLSRDPELAIVPYGEGPISIRRTSGKRAHIIHHYFGGSVQTEDLAIDAGRLNLTARLRDRANSPLEWMEVHIE